MMYYEWIAAALAVIVVYMLLGYVWLWWTTRRERSSGKGKPSDE